MSLQTEPLALVSRVSRAGTKKGVSPNTMVSQFPKIINTIPRSRRVEESMEEWSDLTEEEERENLKTREGKRQSGVPVLISQLGSPQLALQHYHGGHQLVC